MIKFYDYMKKHKMFNEEDIQYVKTREDILCGDLEDLKVRPHVSDRFKLISEVGLKLYGQGPDSIIYTSHKSFDQMPINNVDMNRRGLHIFRMIFSRYRYPLETYTLFDSVGLVIQQDFLKDEYVKLVSEECALYPLVTFKTQENLLVGAHSPGLRHILIDSPLKKVILSFIKAQDNQDAISKFRRNTFIQRVLNKMDDGDEQKVLHSDIFSPAIKFWYFPDEVKLEYGPFNYVKNSVDLTEPLLDFYYDQSNMIALDKWDRKRDRSHPEGSMRIWDEELEQVGLERTPVAVKANTLVIANVGGFHARGDVTKEWTRNSVHGSIRLERPFQ